MWCSARTAVLPPVLTLPISTVLTGLSSTASPTDDFSGRSVSGAGDINGDGIDDLIIGAHSADPNGNNTCRGELCSVRPYGGFAASLDLADLNGTNGFVLNGIDAG